MINCFYDKNEAGGVPTRGEVAEADTWDLTPLFATAAAWNEGFEKLASSYTTISKFQGRIGESATTLRDVLEYEGELSLQIERLYQYASLKSTEDASDSENLARESRMQNLLTKIGEAAAFVSPEIQAIDDTTFAAYLNDPALSTWKIQLNRLRRLKPHTLSSAEERLLALGSSAISGHDETFSQLTNVDMKFGEITDEKGAKKTLTQSSYSSFLQKQEREVRKQAFHQFYKEFDDHKFTVASTLANSVKADVFRARARNYPSAREAALFSDDVPVSVYDNLISTVRANLAPLFRYYGLRRRLLKLDEVHHYDTYVPLVSDFQKKTSFDEAIEMVLSSLTPLGDEYVKTLGEGMRTQRWCDRYENKGKRSGAFSSGTYGSPPYIMMNYKDDVFSDVFTLAHEAGHSMHTWFTNKTQLHQDSRYPIFLAEVASTFNEELLTHHLLEKTTDQRMRAYLINRQIDDIRGTVYRQTMFAEFEKIIHAMEEAGEAVTLETFRQSYHALLEAYFGPDFALDPELDLECFRIPHFYNAFYVYKYATGLSAAVALSEQVLKTGDATSYLGFLKSGGSQFPIPTLRAAGVDMSSPAPIQATLDLFARRVAELEEILG